MDDVPPDPFAGDPDDPAASLGDDEDDEPLDPTEREDILADLADLDVFRALLEPQGIRGLVLDCADCGEPHYFGWDLLQANLHDLLHGGRHRVHEPAYGPDPNEFVTWEYARGYVAGVIDSEDR